MFQFLKLNSLTQSKFQTFVCPSVLHLLLNFSIVCSLFYNSKNCSQALQSRSCLLYSKLFYIAPLSYSSSKPFVSISTLFKNLSICSLISFPLRLLGSSNVCALTIFNSNITLTNKSVNSFIFLQASLSKFVSR
ncbi:hypothetical protein MRGR3_0018 [Staphylococcus aureus subsp. aureus MRGR3]|nr:hypothetical protein MRGR3_0018 [Staphylococcus aureus subsp. aureus MRGR3]